MERQPARRSNMSVIPHLFGKLMVVWCVGCGSAFSFYALRILSRTGHDPAGLLSIILAFFGGELALMFGRSALCDKTHQHKEETL